MFFHHSGIPKRILALALTGASVISLGLPVQAASKVDGSDYQSGYSQTISMKTLLIPALNAAADAKSVTRQLTNALAYRQITQADIFEMRSEGVNIPDETLKALSDEGYISSYIYKYFSGEAFTADDFADVFNAAYYYGANPGLMEAGVAYDEDTLLQDFLTVGMSLGRQASADFNLAYFKANYPELAESLGDVNANYYIYYILYGKSNGLVADRLLSDE
ncbi:MAG: hypothetical protein PUE64_11545 [Firmicutes bacterium]|jgi:hypothetical protein|nr:hypothetical protein [Bacillota bacterium]